MFKKKHLLILIAGFAFCTSVFSQVEPRESKKQKTALKLSDRIVFGGNFGLAFGSSTAFIDISPIVGYRINKRFTAGIGAIYQYYKSEYLNTYTAEIFDYKTNIYGGKIWTEYNLIESIGDYIPLDFGSFVLHAENEIINLEVYSLSSTDIITERKWLNSLLVGGGISQRIGSRSAIHLMILWNLTEQDYTPYQNPIMRIGFSF